MGAAPTVVKSLLVIAMLSIGSVRGFRFLKMSSSFAQKFNWVEPRTYVRYQKANFRCGQVRLDLSKPSDQDKPENRTVVDFESIGAAGNLRLNKDRESGPVVDSNVNFGVKKTENEVGGEKPTPSFEQVL
eukprot:758680-Hanusia_phi.AAC.2